MCDIKTDTFCGLAEIYRHIWHTIIIKLDMNFDYLFRSSYMPV